MESFYICFYAILVFILLYCCSYIAFYWFRAFYVIPPQYKVKKLSKKKRKILDQFEHSLFEVHDNYIFYYIPEGISGEDFLSYFGCKTWDELGSKIASGKVDQMKQMAIFDYSPEMDK